MLRWLDELNGITDADNQAKALRAEIRRLRKEPNTVQTRHQIKRLYEQLDALQFKPDYLCVIMDKVKDYHRACRGFTINGVRYHRLLGTNGGVKNETIVFISDKHGDEIRRRIDNGRDMEKELVPAKLEAYKALACSASIPVSSPRGLLVVNDCETEFLANIIYLNDEVGDEPIMEARNGVPVQLNESDGYGLMLPSLADRWASELGIHYRPSGVNTRFSWEKGMVFCFDFLEFAEQVAGQYLVKDVWGDEHDIRDVELILTSSMLKLWDSYTSCEHYLQCCKENKYQFSVTKVCPRELESEHNLNYQFIQVYDLSDEDIDELIRPTMDELKDILYADYHKTILFLKGAGLNEQNIQRLEDDYIKALMIEPELLHDPYIQSKIFQLIKNRINEAKVGVIKVHGNYSIVSGDPYSLCQSIFGLEVTGILKEGEIYNAYWAEQGSEKLACFRAPMSCANNVRAVIPNRSDEARHWYQYMTTSTVLNSWDTIAHALNGCDKDGDLVMLTDNRVLVDNLRPLPALMCVQRKAQKKVVDESDFIQANINSFGDDIGRITNRITSMFEVQSHYPEDSEEYRILDYRIKCGQLLQQNAIDKAKGIVSKPMPREWHDYHRAASIEDPKKRALYISILADKKPYFMRYIYPDLMRQYNTYIKTANKNVLREFQLTLDELLSIPDSELTDHQREFLRLYHLKMPVGMGDCVMNRICRRFESEFNSYLGRHNAATDFDYTIMRSGAEYTCAQRNAIIKLHDSFNRRVQRYAVYASYERVDAIEMHFQIKAMREEFVRDCLNVCSNASTLCDIILDVCYQRSTTKRFAWEICGEEIIQNLLVRRHGMLSYPTASPDGEIEFKGQHFTIAQIQIGGDT